MQDFATIGANLTRFCNHRGESCKNFTNIHFVCFHLFSFIFFRPLLSVLCVFVCFRPFSSVSFFMLFLFYIFAFYTVLYVFIRLSVFMRFCTFLYIFWRFYTFLYGIVHFYPSKNVQICLIHTRMYKNVQKQIQKWMKIYENV